MTTVRKYKTRSIQEAISRIKKDMGPEAMIISTRRIARGVKDPYSRDLFEVSALPSDGLAVAGLPEAEGEGTPCDFVRETPVKADTIKPRMLKNLMPENPMSGNGLETVHNELVGIKDMLLRLNHSQNLPDFFHIYPEALKLYTRLVCAGISETRATLFVKKACVIRDGRMPGEKEIARRVFKSIAKAIIVSSPFKNNPAQPASGDTAFVSFVGPTGVGKTTTIAKLAADLSLKQKKKVGLISIDSYRIGAVEQLKTYAAIIGIPCLAAFTQDDVQDAVRKMKTRDIVLVDTAGQSHLDQERMKELKRFLEWDIPVSCHLVLSASAKPADMKEAARQFSRLNPRTCILTKVDETCECGGILDLLMDSKLPVSFVTNGQKVPEDIITATKKNVFKLLLRS